MRLYKLKTEKQWDGKRHDVPVPAEVSDLLEALQAEGVGEVRRAEEGYKLSTLQGVSVTKPGQYLVIGLDDV